MKRWRGSAWLGLLLLLPATAGRAGEDENGKAPPPPWRVPAQPYLSLPLGGSAPVVDGAVDWDGEWKDAVVLSGFFQRDLNAVAAPQVQLTVGLKLDADTLWVAYETPVYPPGSSLRAFEKRPDGVDGIMSGDHLALEVLPIPPTDPRQLGLAGHFAFLWNSLGTLADLHYNGHPGQDGRDWSSGADLANKVTKTAWTAEMRIPLDRFARVSMENFIHLPPADGDLWGMRFARRFGKEGGNLNTVWDNRPLALRAEDTQAIIAALRELPRVRLREGGLAVRVRGLGNLVEGKLAAEIGFFNRDETPHEAMVKLLVQDSEGKKIWAAEKAVEVGPGAGAACPAIEADLPIEPRGSRLFLKILQDGKTPLYVTPGLDLVKFDESLRAQYMRSLEILR